MTAAIANLSSREHGSFCPLNFFPPLSSQQRCAQSSATALHGIFPLLQISSPFHSTQSTANIYFLSFHLNLFINRDSCPNKPPPQFVYERNLSVFTDCAKLFCNASARRGMIGQVKDDAMYAEWVRIGDAGCRLLIAPEYKPCLVQAIRRKGPIHPSTTSWKLQMLHSPCRIDGASNSHRLQSHTNSAVWPKASTSPA